MLRSVDGSQETRTFCLLLCLSEYFSLPRFANDSFVQKNRRLERFSTLFNKQKDVALKDLRGL